MSENNNGDSPRWWLLFRRVVIFFLGVIVIVDSLVDDDSSIWKLVMGVIMIGVLPIEDISKLVPPRTSFRRGDVR